jgi:hypothetical protein
MNTRVKAGDLAYLIKATAPENVGRVLEVIEFAGDYDDGYGDRWLCKAATPIKAFTSDNVFYGLVTEIHAPDDWLRPIAGPSIGDVADDNSIINDELVATK